MNGEYKTLANKSFEGNALFFGQEACPPNYTYKGNNVRDCYVIHYIQEGKGTFAAANHPATVLKAGDIFILPKGTPCFYQADNDQPWKYFWIGFSGIRIEAMLSGSLLAHKCYLRQVQNGQFYADLSELYKVLHIPNSLVNDVLVESLIYRMFYDLLRRYPANATNIKVKSTEQFNLAVSYLQENYSTGCTIMDLCHYLNLSRSYLYTLFKTHANTSPQKLLTKLRLEDAKQRLSTSNNSVQSIANMVGYKDSFTFSKAFKRYSGASPSYYRKSIEI